MLDFEKFLDWLLFIYNFTFRSAFIATIGHAAAIAMLRVGISASFDRIKEDRGAGSVSFELESIQFALQRRT